MLLISRAASLIALAAAVLSTNFSQIQYARAELIEITGFQSTEESQEVITEGAPTVQPRPVITDAYQTVQSAELATDEYQTVLPSEQEWELDSNPIEIYTPIELFDAPHSDFTTELDSIAQHEMIQGSIHSDFPTQTSDVSDFPVTIILKDVGYNGPGDMRTHLWKDHSSDLEANGISHETLMSMPLESVQKWHNYFHGTESAPDSH